MEALHAYRLGVAAAGGLRQCRRGAESIDRSGLLVHLAAKCNGPAGSSSMITRHAKRVRPDRLDPYAPCDATAAAPCQTTAAPMAVPPGVGLGARHFGGGAAALSPGAALPDRQSGFDPDALALGNGRARRAKLRADRAHGAGAADDRDRLRGWPLLQPSRHRLARVARAARR